MATIDAPLPSRNRSQRRAGYKRKTSFGDPTARARWQSQCNQAVEDGKISLQCMGWLMRLSEQSNATAKKVWGWQKKQAQKIHRSERSVRIYRQEAEAAGLIETVRGKVIRHSDGRFSQQFTNTYIFLVPKLVRKVKALFAPCGNTQPPKTPIPSELDKTLDNEYLNLLLGPPEETNELPTWHLERQAARRALPA